MSEAPDFRALAQDLGRTTVHSHAYWGKPLGEMAAAVAVGVYSEADVLRSVEWYRKHLLWIAPQSWKALLREYAR